MTHAVGCVVFDLDDTVYLERDYVHSGFRAVGDWASAELGMTAFAEQAWDRFEAGARGTIFDDVLRESNVDPTPERVRALVEVYRCHQPAIELLADAALAVTSLSAEMPIGVVTDGPPESQRAKARALGVDQWAEVAVFTAELGEGFGKPHPRAFHDVEQRFGITGPRCVYVADNPTKDFGGPRSLGWRTVRVCRAGSLHRALPSGPDVDVELTDLGPLPLELGFTPR